MSLTDSLDDVKRLASQIRASLPVCGERWSLRPKVFELARRVKDVDPNIDAATLDAVANEWHRGAGAAVAGVEPAEVRAKLKNAFAKCRYGLSAPTLAGEFAKCKAEPLSDVARRFTRNPNLRDTVVACEVAARLNGGDEFPLSQRRLGELLSVSQPRAGEYLAVLVEAGVIVETRGYVKGKWPKSYRLVTVVKTVAEKFAEKLAEVVATIRKLTAGMVGSVSATSEPTEPAEQAEPSEPSERAWWEADPNQPTYTPPAMQPASRASRERNGPRARSAGGWRFRSWREVVFGMCRPRPRPKPAQNSEPEVV